MVKVGDLIGVLNEMWLDKPPYPYPLVVTKVTKARITAEAFVEAGDERGAGKQRYLKPADIIAVFPDEATARARCKAAYAEHRTLTQNIRDLEGERALTIKARLRGEG